MYLDKKNFASTSEEAINQQINTELQASQVYLSMAAWAQHSSIALPGKSVLMRHFRSSPLVTDINSYNRS
jgi:ferritin heavy chain